MNTKLRQTKIWGEREREGMEAEVRGGEERAAEREGKDSRAEEGSLEVARHECS